MTSPEPEALFEIQIKLIYAMIVAGKSAAFADTACRRLFQGLPHRTLPFRWIREMDSDALMIRLREARTGNYGKLHRGLQELTRAHLDLRVCGPEELEQIHGVGPKTSRFWLLWTRPDANYAALDVHVLRWLRAQGHAAPKQTPSSAKAYAALEKVFLEEAKRRGLTARELDLQIWEAASSAANKHRQDLLAPQPVRQPAQQPR